MPPRNKAAAPVVAARAEAAVPAGFKPCTYGSHELIVDPKGWCGIPFDTNDDGFRSFRAFIVPRGKSTHVPNVPGHYALVGTKPEVLVAPLLVHFQPSTGRKPELLVTFVDYAMGNAELSGVSVEALDLPLKKSHNNYARHPNLSKMELVAGFSPVPVSTPYTVDLEPTLKVNKPWSTLKLSSQSDALAWIDKGLAQRISTLFQHAEAALEAHVQEVKKAGNERSATQQQGVFQAKLQRMREMIQAMPPQAYDARINSRFVLLEEADPNPEWMASPLRQSMTGGAAQLVRTRLGKSVAQPPAAASSSADTGAAPMLEAGRPSPMRRARGLVDDDELSSVSSSESEGQGEAAAALALPPQNSGLGKRARIATNHFVAGAAAGAAAGVKATASAKKQKRAPKAQRQLKQGATSKEEKAQKKAHENEQKRRQLELNKALGLKPNGEPYVRPGGAYNKHVLPHAGSEAVREAARAMTSADSVELQRLRGENSKLREELAEKDRRISTLELEAAKHTSELAGAEAKVHMSYTAKMEAQFHKGAAFASKIASGGVYEYTPVPMALNETPS